MDTDESDISEAAEYELRAELYRERHARETANMNSASSRPPVDNSPLNVATSTAYSDAGPDTEEDVFYNQEVTACEKRTWGKPDFRRQDNSTPFMGVMYSIPHRDADLPVELAQAIDRFCSTLHTLRCMPRTIHIKDVPVFTTPRLQREVRVSQSLTKDFALKKSSDAAANAGCYVIDGFKPTNNRRNHYRDDQHVYLSAWRADYGTARGSFIPEVPATLAQVFQHVVGFLPRPIGSSKDQVAFVENLIVTFGGKITKNYSPNKSVRSADGLQPTHLIFIHSEYFSAEHAADVKKSGIIAVSAPWVFCSLLAEMKLPVGMFLPAQKSSDRGDHRSYNLSKAVIRSLPNASSDHIFGCTLASREPIEKRDNRPPFFKPGTKVIIATDTYNPITRLLSHLVLRSGGVPFSCFRGDNVNSRRVIYSNKKAYFICDERTQNSDAFLWAVPLGLIICTSQWLLDCVAKGVLIDPMSSILYYPPPSGGYKVTLPASKFDGSVYLHASIDCDKLRKLAADLGFKIDRSATRATLVVLPHESEIVDLGHLAYTSGSHAGKKVFLSWLEDAFHNWSLPSMDDDMLIISDALEAFIKKRDSGFTESQEEQPFVTWDPPPLRASWIEKTAGLMSRWEMAKSNKSFHKR